MQPTPYGSTRSTSYADRLLGALRLDARTYREVEQDSNANGQAALTIVLAALAAGIGVILSRDVVQNVLGVVLSSVLQWIIFSFVAYYVGASLFATGQTSVTPGQVLRTIGFAHAPKLFLVLGIIPILGWIVGLVVFIWFLAAAILAAARGVRVRYRSSDRHRSGGIDRHPHRRHHLERGFRDQLGALRRVAVGARAGF